MRALQILESHSPVNSLTKSTLPPKLRLSPKTAGIFLSWTHSLDSFHESPNSRNRRLSFWSGSLFFLNMVLHGGCRAAQSWVGLSALTVGAVPVPSFGVLWSHLVGDTVSCQVPETWELFSHMPLISHVNINLDHGSSWKLLLGGLFCCQEGLKVCPFDHCFQSLAINIHAFYRSSFTQGERVDFPTWRDFWVSEGLPHNPSPPPPHHLSCLRDDAW